MSAKYYVGIDLGSRFHQVAVVDHESGLVRPSFRIGRGRAGVELLMRTLNVPGSSLVVSIEATANYWWELVGSLTQRGSQVYLISPKKGHDLRRFYALHTKTDVNDAEALARMPLVDPSLCPVWVAKEIRKRYGGCGLSRYRSTKCDDERRPVDTATVVGYYRLCSAARHRASKSQRDT